MAQAFFALKAIAKLILAAAIALFVIRLGRLTLGFSALSDYFRFTAEYIQNNPSWRLIAQVALGTGLYVVFGMLFCLRLMTPINNSMNPYGWKELIDRLVRLIIVIVPGAVISYMLIESARDVTSGKLIIWSAAAVVILTAVLQIGFSVFIRWSTAITMSYAGPYLITYALFAALGLYFWIRFNVIGATFFIGGIGIIFLFLIFVLVLFELLAVTFKPFPELFGLVIVGFVVSQFVNVLPAEFSHTSDSRVKDGTSLEDAIKVRDISMLAPAFSAWLDKRYPQEKRLPTDKKYPVFVVAAQGGGLYAAYHTALSLARLYDSCPKMKDHVFAISGVSGGSFGAAMFSQLLLKNQATLGDTCSEQSPSVHPLEDSVDQFFQFDFVTPVIATGLLVDIPNFAIPWLGSGHDRAHTLELAYENALCFTLGSNPPGSDFYSWKPESAAPALFLNATNVNYGRPIIISQVYMADKQSEPAFLAILDRVKKRFGSLAEGDEKFTSTLQEQLTSGIRKSTYSRPAYYNVLEYRKDLKLSLSTAAVLSARFPYVTPPGALYSDGKNAAIDALLNETKALQLIDGGFWDNSGIATADEIVKQLRASDLTKDVVANVEFHLISFGHSNAALQLEGDRGALNEFIAPITTFEAMREARSLNETDAKAAGFNVVHGYQLFDQEFQAPLSWTLSKYVRSQIGLRSGGTNVEPSVCCKLSLPWLMDWSYPEMIVDAKRFRQVWQPDLKANALRFNLSPVAPNVRQYKSIIQALSDNPQSVTDAAK